MTNDDHTRQVHDPMQVQLQQIRELPEAPTKHDCVGAREICEWCIRDMHGEMCR